MKDNFRQTLSAGLGLLEKEIYHMKVKEDDFIGWHWL